MAYDNAENGVKSTGLVAGADLSAGQYCFVKISGNDTVVLCAASTDIPVGVLQNAPLAGEAADVLHSGVSRLRIGAAVTAGQELMSNASGRAIPAATATNRAGLAMAQNGASNNGEIITAIIGVATRVI